MSLGLIFCGIVDMQKIQHIKKAARTPAAEFREEYLDDVIPALRHCVVIVTF